MEPFEARHRNIRYLDHDLTQEESLRHLIRTRFTPGMTEEFIALILGDVLEGLRHIHVVKKCGYEQTTRDIFFSHGESGVDIGVAFLKTSLVPRADTWEKCTDGIWGVGIIALELAYGSVPSGEELIAMAENLCKIIKREFSQFSSKTLIFPDHEMLFTPLKSLENEEMMESIL